MNNGSSTGHFEVDRKPWESAPWTYSNAAVPAVSSFPFEADTTAPITCFSRLSSHDLVGVCTYTSEEQEIRSIWRKLFSYLNALSESDLEAGRRSYVMLKLVDEYRDSESEFIAAAKVLLSASGHVVADEAKAALLRAIASRPNFEGRSEFMHLCISSLWSEDQLHAVAAARTLGEIADVSALPQIRHAAGYVSCGRLKGVIREAIAEIERANATDARIAEGD